MRFGRGQSRLNNALTLILFVIFLAALGVFAYFASIVVNFPSEVTVSTWIQSHRSPWLDGIMRAVSMSDETFVILPIPFLIALVIYLKGWHAESILMALGSTSGIVLTTLLKRVIARPRPTPDLVEVLDQVSSYSFPSGNVMLYSVYLGIVTFILVTRFRQGLSLKITLSAFGIILLIIGYSRIYLGAHWLGDVIGGYAFGAALVIASIWIWRRLYVKYRHETEPDTL